MTISVQSIAWKSDPNGGEASLGKLWHDFFESAGLHPTATQLFVSNSAITLMQFLIIYV